VLPDLSSLRHAMLIYILCSTPCGLFFALFEPVTGGFCAMKTILVLGLEGIFSHSRPLFSEACYVYVLYVYVLYTCYIH
jgi:hypothetical protein